MRLPLQDVFISLVSLQLLTGLSSALVCHPFNDIYPPLHNLSSNAISSATNQLNSTFASLLANKTVISLINTTSFSLDIFSVQSSKPIFTFHYSAPSLATSTEGVTQVNSDSIYRVGSISKLWTLYIWLLAAGDQSFNDPITKYVPELAEYASNHTGDDQVDVVDWNSITVGSLASQMSGISRDPTSGEQGDTLIQQALNLPPPAHEAPNSDFCGESDSLILFYCNRTAFFNDNLFRSPSTRSFESPVYSNTAFQILAYALETITNTTFEDLFQSKLIETHSLKSTFYTVPPTSNNSVIPVNASASLYNTDFRESSPFGGYYSSLNDMTTIARAILNSTHLSPAQTRRWMKPVAFLPPGPLFSNGGSVQAVGSPWEIIRGPAPRNASLLNAFTGTNTISTSNSTPPNHQTWIYTKEGDVGAYTSLTALIPEFNTGFTVLTAGAKSNAIALYLADILTEIFIPAFFEAARTETESTYTASFVDTATNSSATIILPPSSSSGSGSGSEDDASANTQGLQLAELIYNGTDFLQLVSTSLYGLPAGHTLQITLYPNKLVSHNTANTALHEGWKAFFSVPTNASATAAGAFTSACWAWAQVGGLNYGGVAFDDIRFRVEVDAQGRRTAMGLEIPVFGVNMTRSE